MSFDEKTTVEIESESKDFAYLLNSDLKEYLKTEVMIFRPQIFTRSRIHKAVLLIIPVLLMVLMSLMLGAEMSQKDFDNLLHPQMFRRSSISS